MRTEMELTVLAALLRRGRALDRLSHWLTLLSLAFGLAQLLLERAVLHYALLAAVVVVLGVWQLYWAQRGALDAELFDWLGSDAEQLPARTEVLDLTLVKLGLQPAARSGRPWPERQRGTLRLLRYQASLVLAQVLVVLGGMLIFPQF